MCVEGLLRQEPSTRSILCHTVFGQHVHSSALWLLVDQTMDLPRASQSAPCLLQTPTPLGSSHSMIDRVVTDTRAPDVRGNTVDATVASVFVVVEILLGPVKHLLLCSHKRPNVPNVLKEDGTWKVNSSGLGARDGILPAVDMRISCYDCRKRPGLVLPNINHRLLNVEQVAIRYKYAERNVQHAIHHLLMHGKLGWAVWLLAVLLAELLGNSDSGTQLCACRLPYRSMMRKYSVNDGLLWQITWGVL